MYFSLTSIKLVKKETILLIINWIVLLFKRHEVSDKNVRAGENLSNFLIKILLKNKQRLEFSHDHKWEREAGRIKICFQVFCDAYVKITFFSC